MHKLCDLVMTHFWDHLYVPCSTKFLMCFISTIHVRGTHVLQPCSCYSPKSRIKALLIFNLCVTHVLVRSKTTDQTFLCQLQNVLIHFKCTVCLLMLASEWLILQQRLFAIGPLLGKLQGKSNSAVLGHLIALEFTVLSPFWQAYVNIHYSFYLLQRSCCNF
jgi:hypothetical protein